MTVRTFLVGAAVAGWIPARQAADADPLRRD